MPYHAFDDIADAPFRNGLGISSYPESDPEMGKEESGGAPERAKTPQMLDKDEAELMEYINMSLPEKYELVKSIEELYSGHLVIVLLEYFTSTQINVCQIKVYLYLCDFVCLILIATLG